MSPFKATIGNVSLRQLFAAQIPSDFADWLDFVAIGALLAFTWHVEPYVFATLAVCMGLPYLVIGPFAGVIVDRAPILRVMIASNIARAIMTALLAFAPDWQILVGIVFVRSTVDAFYTPAKQAAIQALAPPEALMPANGISHAINQASKIVAPALGGALLIILTPRSIFLCNTGVSLLAALMLLRMAPIPKVLPTSKAKLSILAELKEGMGVVLKTPTLRAALSIMAAGYFAMFFYDTLIAPLTRDLGFSETTLGLALAAVGLGGVSGAIWMGMRNTARPFLWIAAGLILSAVLIATLGVFEITDRTLAMSVFLTLFTLVGFASTMSVVPIRTIIQRDTPSDKIARVSALSEAANMSALLTAPFIGAMIASLSSIGVAFVAGAILMLMIGIWAGVLHKTV
ncbi:MAG: MFS transporter [Paracoccaceae bacterium]